MAVALAVTAITFGIGAVLSVIAALEDRRSHLLRNVYTAPLAGAAVVGFTTAALLAGDELPIGAMGAGVGIYAGPWFVTHVVSPALIGFGDTKYAAGLGIYLGWLTPTAALTGFFASSIMFVVSARRSNRPTAEPVPFGPSLCAGAILAATAHAPW